MVFFYHALYVWWSSCSSAITRQRSTMKPTKKHKVNLPNEKPALPCPALSCLVLPCLSRLGVEEKRLGVEKNAPPNQWWRISVAKVHLGFMVKRLWMQSSHHFCIFWNGHLMPFLCVFIRCFFVAVAFDALCISSFSVLFSSPSCSPLLCCVSL